MSEGNTYFREIFAENERRAAAGEPPLTEAQSSELWDQLQAEGDKKPTTSIIANTVRAWERAEQASEEMEAAARKARYRSAENGQ